MNGHIINLQAENIKNLKAISITPEGNLVRITGPNGAGKSAIFECIIAAIKGESYEDFIKHGEERGEINMQIDDFKIKKVFTAKGARLEITTLAGDKKSSPATFLESLYGRLTFDPLAFLRMDAKKQWEVLRELAGLDFSDIEKEYKSVYDERARFNANVRDVIAQLEGMTAPDPETPSEEISYSEALKEIDILRTRKESFKRALEARGFVEKDLLNAQKNIKDAIDQIAILQEQLKGYQDFEESKKKELEEFLLPEEVNEQTIMARQADIQDIENKNVAIRNAGRYRKLVKEADKLKNEAEVYTQKLDRLTQDRQTRIANAKFPVTGLSLGDMSVLFEDTPLSRINKGKQIRISTAIAMALNPKLKLILIQDASLLDKEGLKELSAMADEGNYQILIETVAESLLDDKGNKVYPVGIYIEDGTVEAIDGKKVESEPTTQKEEAGNVKQQETEGVAK